MLSKEGIRYRKTSVIIYYGTSLFCSNSKLGFRLVLCPLFILIVYLNTVHFHGMLTEYEIKSNEIMQEKVNVRNEIK